MSAQPAHLAPPPEPLILERRPGAGGEDAGHRRRQRLVDHLHQLGPRPAYELLMELAREHGIGADIDHRLERYGQLRADVVRALDVDRHQPPPLHVVDGGGQ